MSHWCIRMCVPGSSSPPATVLNLRADPPRMYRSNHWIGVGTAPARPSLRSCFLVSVRPIVSCSPLCSAPAMPTPGIRLWTVVHATSGQQRPALDHRPADSSSNFQGEREKLIIDRRCSCLNARALAGSGHSSEAIAVGN